MQPSDFPPGMIGVASGELARYSDFTTSMVAMMPHCPPGTQYMAAYGLGPARPFNGIAERFLANPELQWLFLTNDDNLCPPDTILRLLRHRLDVVSGLYFGRMQPFEPILFDTIDMGEKNGFPGMRKWYNRHLMETGESGLVRASAVGDGCLLIRRYVLENIPDPWWEYGETLSDCCDHDMVFSRKVLTHGFDLWCDLDLIVDHISNFVVRPYRAEDGTWHVRLVQNDRMLTVPAPQPGQKEVK